MNRRMALKGIVTGWPLALVDSHGAVPSRNPLGLTALGEAVRWRIMKQRFQARWGWVRQRQWTDDASADPVQVQIFDWSYEQDIRLAAQIRRWGL